MIHVVFRVGDSTYSIPAQVVQSIEANGKLVSADSSDPLFLGFMLVRGRAIPVFSSWRLLEKEESSRNMVMVLDTEYGRIGIAVDEVEDVLELHEDDLNPQSISDMFLGTFRLGHEDAFVINPDTLIRSMGVS